MQHIRTVVLDRLKYKCELPCYVGARVLAVRSTHNALVLDILQDEDARKTTLRVQIHGVNWGIENGALDAYTHVGYATLDRCLYHVFVQMES